MKKLIFCFLMILFSINLKSQWDFYLVNFNIISEGPNSSPNPLYGIGKFSIIDSNNVWAVTKKYTSNKNYNYYLKTNNGGLSWMKDSVPNTYNLNINSIHCINNNTVFISFNKDYSGTIPKLFHTTDGGLTWNIANVGFNSNTKINFIYFFNSNEGICVCDPVNGNWEIFKTNDGGNIWNQVNTSNIPNPVLNEKGNENVYSVNSNKLFFGTNKGRIYTTSNNGSSWSVSNTPLNNVISISLANNGYGLAKDSTQLISTINNGNTWNTLNYQGRLNNDKICNVRGNDSTFYNTGYISSGRTGLSFSNDGGLNWNILDTNLYYSDIIFLNQNFGWAGGLSMKTGVPSFNLPIFKKINSSTSIEKQELNKIFSFPNPTEDYLFLKNITDEKFDLKIINHIGQIVKDYNYSVTQNFIMINTSALLTGVYSILINSNNRIYKNVFIKK